MTTATGTDIMHALIEAATWLGYHVHHETDSRRTNPGYPDLTIVGHGAIFVIETKSRGERFIPPRTTKRGKTLPGQIDWLAAFAATGKAHTYVCRPRREDLAPSDGDWQEIAYDDLLAVLREQRIPQAHRGGKQPMTERAQDARIDARLLKLADIVQEQVRCFDAGRGYPECDAISKQWDQLARELTAALTPSPAPADDRVTVEVEVKDLVFAINQLDQLSRIQNGLMYTDILATTFRSLINANDNSPLTYDDVPALAREDAHE